MFIVNRECFLPLKKEYTYYLLLMFSKVHLILPLFQVSAIEQDMIEVDPDTKEMLKVLVRLVFIPSKTACIFQNNKIMLIQRETAVRKLAISPLSSIYILYKFLIYFFKARIYWFTLKMGTLRFNGKTNTDLYQKCNIGQQ